MDIPKTFPKDVPEAFPARAGRGTSILTIYRTRNRNYEQFKIPFRDGGKRRFHLFQTYDAAREKGNEMLNQLHNGDSEAIKFTNADMAIYDRAVEYLLPTGYAVDRVAFDYATFWNQMGGDFFKEAITQFMERRNTLKPINIPDLVKVFVEQKSACTKRGRPASDDYVKDLKSRLGRFAGQFPGPVVSIKSEHVVDFLDGLELEPRTVFNYARLLKTFFNFAQSRRYYPKDIDPMEDVDTDYDDVKDIAIFTPDELRRLLAACRSEFLPFLLIGAFAGLRHAEIKRLEWQEVDLARGFIEIKAAKAKTRSRRLVPISANLKSWLQTHWKESGKVCPFENCAKQIMWLVEDVNEKDEGEQNKAAFVWKRNGLRHSFISYRTAEIQHIDQVALEAGNSPQMIFNNYRELVRPDEAKSWFSIMPETVKTA